MFILLNCTFLSAQSIGFLMPKNKISAKIPFEYINNFIIIELSFNQSLPLKFVFDTGAENTLFTKREVLELFGYELGRKFTVLGSDMKTELTAYLVQKVHLSTDLLKAPSQDVLVLEEDYIDFEKFIGIQIHGIAAADLFKRYIVKIDYQQKEIQLYRKLPKKLSKYQKAPIVIERSKPYLNAPINIDGNVSFPAKLLIDTGADLGLLVNVKSDSSLNIPPNNLPCNIGIGLGGYLEGYLARVNALEIANYRFENLIGSFQNDTELANSISVSKRNGIVGNRILDRFTIIIDYLDEHIYLKGTKKWQKAYNYDKSGLTFILTGIRRRDFIIQQVIENSSADLAGLKRGDKLKRINATPSFLLSLSTLNHKLSRKVGKEIKLMIIRDGNLLKKKFKLKEII